MSALELEEQREPAAQEPRPTYSRAPQPAAWGVFLSLIALMLLGAVSGGILLASQEWRILACQSLATRLSARFAAPLKTFEASLPEQEEILRELDSGISSLFLLEPLTGTLESLLGEAGGDRASATFAEALLSEIKTRHSLLTGNSSDQGKHLLRAGLSASARGIEFPLGLSNREEFEESMNEAGLRISASANLLEGTTQAWSAHLEKIRTLRQRIELVRADAAQFFGIGSLDESEQASQNNDPDASSLPSLFYSSGILANFPALPSLPDGLTTPDELRAAIVNAGGAALAADGTSAQERQARFAELQSTGAALMKEAQDLESTANSILATLDSQVLDLKTQQISWLQLASRILRGVLEDLSSKLARFLTSLPTEQANS